LDNVGKRLNDKKCKPVLTEINPREYSSPIKAVGTEFNHPDSAALIAPSVKGSNLIKLELFRIGCALQQ